MDDASPITKDEFDKKIKDIKAVLKALPPEKRLGLLKELNAYLKELSADLTELDTLIKEERQIEELKSKVVADYSE